jgi:hypothetical protein
MQSLFLIQLTQSTTSLSVVVAVVDLVAVVQAE